MTGSVLIRPRATSRLAAWRLATGPEQVLKIGLAACSVTAIGAFLIAALFRLSYPFPFESTEPTSLEQVNRIMRGQALYVAPDLQHIPMVYGPIYFYVSAALAELIGSSYVPLRLVSLLASVVSLLLVGYLVKHETRRWIGAVAAAGLLAISYPLSQTAFDTARVDALFTSLLLGGAVLARVRVDVGGLAAAGVLVGLAGLTKLPIGAAPVAVALAVYLAITARGRAVAFVLACGTTLALGLLLLRLQSGPWPTWFLLDLPSRHVINNHGDLLGRFWFLDVLPRFTFPLLIGPVFLLLGWGRGDRRPLLFYACIGLSMIGLAWAARSNSGGVQNVLIPAYAVVALLFGLGVDAMLRMLASTSTRLRVLQGYVLVLCIAQFALNAYNPRLLVPYRSEQWAAERLSSTLAGLDGPLFALNLDGYVLGSSKGQQPLTGALQEITGSFGGPSTDVGEQWKTDFATALRERRYSHVVLAEDCCGVREALTNNGYELAGPLFAPGDDYWLWTNGRTPDQIDVYVPSATTR